MMGTANMKMYDGAALAGHGDVIVASMNYRVGTLGFFSGKNFFSGFNLCFCNFYKFSIILNVRSSYLINHENTHMLL